MDNVRITANTEVISRQAGELKHYCDEVSKDFPTIQNAILSRCLKEISTYPDKLGIIATEYANEDIEEVNTLESDIKI